MTDKEAEELGYLLDGVADKLPFPWDWYNEDFDPFVSPLDSPRIDTEQDNTDG